ncbi:hypothetical protein LTR86_009055 [Recurvomyces mirabilis]|nr:hypothetical protein LTR86_009055 [Recurvomyces mirabilis]
MLGSAVPATATLQTSTSSAIPSSPTRPSRLRGLSYLRSVTREHLYSHTSSQPYSRSDAPPLTRSASSPIGASFPTIATTTARTIDENNNNNHTSGIQNGENGWLPTVQGRNDLTSTSTESAAPEPPTNNPTMTRTRASTTIASGPTPATLPSSTTTRRQPSSTPLDMAQDTTTPLEPTTSNTGLPTIRFIPHIETRSTRPSLHFPATTRTLKPPLSLVRVGRYSERDALSSPDPNTVPIGFKSKVVSRRHCEFWCSGGQWYIKDVKSSSGTFLNHVRLSPPGQESRPFEVRDGDTVQLGIDFKGGEEVIFRCVKIRVECNRGWQKSLNTYNTTAHKKLLKNALAKKGRDSDAASVNSSECSICLNPVAPCQALFVAPCSHVWHYKCVRNLIHGPSWPNFLCPNCRFVADLEADVEPPEEEEFEAFDEEDDEGVEGRGGGEGEEAGDGDAARETDDTAAEERRHSDERHGDELAGIMDRTSLNHDSESSAPIPANSLALLSPPSTSTSATQPLDIQQRRQNRSRSRSGSPRQDLLGARSTTPTTTLQFALAAGVVVPEGPMTPRNDVGPFVLDGSGSGDRGRVGTMGEVMDQGGDGDAWRRHNHDHDHNDEDGLDGLGHR